MSAEGWAIFALPPGSRDLGCPEVWERSLARSRCRREAAAARRANRSKSAVPAALMAATLVVPTAQVARAQQTVATSPIGAGDLRIGSRGPAVAAAQRALGIPADGVFGRQTRRAVRAFQRGRGLAVDGVIGPITRGALGAAAPAARPESGPPRWRCSARSASRPTATTARSRAPRCGGSRSRAASSVDGVAGPQTLGALGLPGNVTLGEQHAAGGRRPAPRAAVAAARSAVGTPYAYGGNGPGTYDCSGLTVFAMRQAGISLPRTSFSQFGVGTPVVRGAIQAGDLVFFNANGAGASHVGIATSPTTVISATTHGVMEHSIAAGYWSSHYVGARRVG